MWDRWPHLLQPLTKLTSNKSMFRWIEFEQKSFEDIKCIVVHDTLLSYLYLNKGFDIHTDTINC